MTCPICNDLPAMVRVALPDELGDSHPTAACYVCALDLFRAWRQQQRAAETAGKEAEQCPEAA